MAISPQRLTIYLYSAHRAVIFAIAQLSCYYMVVAVLHVLPRHSTRLTQQENVSSTALIFNKTDHGPVSTPTDQLVEIAHTMLLGSFRRRRFSTNMAILCSSTHSTQSIFIKDRYDTIRYERRV